MTSGTATVSLYAHNQLVGTLDTYCCGASDSGESFSAYWPHTAYFCPLCGDIWARAVYTYNFSYVPRVRDTWAIETRRCERHGDGQLLIGRSLERVSSAVLLREFLLLTKDSQP